MGAITTNAFVKALNDLEMDAVQMRWLIKLMQDLSLEVLRGGDISILVDVVLRRKWPQQQLTGLQRDGVYTLFNGATRQDLSELILLAKNLGR